MAGSSPGPHEGVGLGGGDVEDLRHLGELQEPLGHVDSSSGTVSSTASTTPVPVAPRPGTDPPPDCHSSGRSTAGNVLILGIGAAVIVRRPQLCTWTGGLRPVDARCCRVVRCLRRRAQASTSGPQGAHMTELASPSAKRLQRPSWRDSRLVVGVLLVVVAATLGAKAVASADDRVPVWVAASNLVAGDEVEAGILRACGRAARGRHDRLPRRRRARPDRLVHGARRARRRARARVRRSVAPTPSTCSG